MEYSTFIKMKIMIKIFKIEVYCKPFNKAVDISKIKCNKWKGKSKKIMAF